MKKLSFFEEKLNNCSRCGLCQAVCPIFQITKNDCTSPKGICVMLNNLLKSKEKPSKEMIKYINTCTNCGKCLEYCPSMIDIVKIKAAFNKDFSIKPHFLKSFLFKIYLSIIKILCKITSKKEINGKIAYIKPYLQEEIPKNIKEYHPEIIDSFGCDFNFIIQNPELSKKLSFNLAQKLLSENYDFILTDNILCKYEADKGIKLLNSSKKTIFYL